MTRLSVFAYDFRLLHGWLQGPGARKQIWERTLTRQLRAILGRLPSPKKKPPVHGRAGTSLAFVIMTVVLQLRCAGLSQCGSRRGSCGLGVWRRCCNGTLHMQLCTRAASTISGRSYARNARDTLRNSTPALSYMWGLLEPNPQLAISIKLMSTVQAASIGRGRSVLFLRTHLPNGELGDQ